MNAIVKALPFTEHNPKRFPGAIFRLKKPRPVTLLFRTGKMVSVGPKPEKMAVTAVRKVIKELKKAGTLMTGSQR